MNSGTVLTQFKYFDAWFGAHQKIDRVARRNLAELIKRSDSFPTNKAIRKFEGVNGPDGIKVKALTDQEPWHFYDPFDPSDKKILNIIEDHFQELVQALRTHNKVRSSFEAAWLAHAVVDGLTPAHHYPYKEELKKLHGGESKESKSIKLKLVIPGETLSKRVHNNWKMWGDKGLVASHLAFEMGIAAMIIPLRFQSSYPSADDIKELQSKGFIELFRQRATQIAGMHMYEAFCKSGWTPKLAKQVRRELMPPIINAVTLTWYAAVLKAEKA